MYESNPQRKVKGIHLIYLELEKCKKRSIFNMNSIQEKWITFLTEPEKLMTMSTKEKHDYPFLIKAVELLDESKYTIGQLIAYDKYIDGVMSWNTNMAHSFDNGFDEGMEKGMEEGANKTIEILQELKDGNKSLDQIAIDYNISKEKVLELKNLIGG